MFSDLMQPLGGLGLFLLGMVVMTDGLRGLAGDYFNRLLARFTNSVASGAATGAVSTAVLQSSSATTVAAVGFVGAGLLSFPQALGIIFGANFGTTITGWLVALLGLKLKIGTLMMPLILIGTLMRLFGRERLAQLGFALAGFGLIFLGISHLQLGMADYQGLVTPSDFPADTLGGRLQLVAIGIAITLVTQSSSAGVATALTAVYTGALSFPQAAAMVIGMDVGTTVTAAIATLGGSPETRRTGYSHVTYNLITAAGALLLLSPYAWAWEQASPGALSDNAEIALVGFHSLFNLLGLLLVLPFARQFAHLMYRLVPISADPVVGRLDPLLLRNPPVALDAVQQVMKRESEHLLRVLAALLEGRGRPPPRALEDLACHLDALHHFVDQLHLRPEQGRQWARLNTTMHLLDHLQRLHERCEEEPDRAEGLFGVPGLKDRAAQAAALVVELGTARQRNDWLFAERKAEVLARELRQAAPALRAEILAEVAAGAFDVPEGTRRLEAVRWLRRVTFHVWRICEHSADMQNVTQSRGFGK